jgi:hypothetical protein
MSESVRNGLLGDAVNDLVNATAQEEKGRRYDIVVFMPLTLAMDQDSFGRDKGPIEKQILTRNKDCGDVEKHGNDQGMR